MPQIAVNLGAVEAFENLPFGSYLGDITRIKLMQPTQAGKFAQLMVTYLVVDGDCLGKKQSEWLSMSPKAAFRLKKWFSKFGLGDTENFDVDDDTELLIDPDLIGARVIFVVKPDGERVRTELLSVEDVAPAPVPKARPVAAVPAAPAAPPEPVVDQAAIDRAARIAETKAALAALEAEETAPVTPAAEPVRVAPRRPAAPAAPAVAEQPAVRRTLR